MVTIRIGGYDVKRVLVDQGSGAEIMYPDLYGGLNLRPEDLERYDSLLFFLLLPLSLRCLGHFLFGFHI